MDNDLLEADAMLADVEAKLASALKKHEVNATLERRSNEISQPDARALQAAARKQAKAFAARPWPHAQPLSVPKPLKYEPVAVTASVLNGKVTYTDCMESSLLRFMQLALCDLSTISHDGMPTRVDDELVRCRVKDADARAFFEKYPEILPAAEYSYVNLKPGKGCAARNDWAQLVTHKRFFTYKRDTGGVYKNDALTGKVAQRGEWLLELEPCVHNVMSALTHFLSVDFSACRAPDGRRMPWEKAWSLSA